MITIHNFPRGARGIRVFWVCEEMGLPYRAEALSYPVGAAYRALNPMGSVPFLEDEGGVAINESVAQILYLADRYGPTPLLPADDAAARARVIQLTIFGETALGAYMNPLMMTKFGAPADTDKTNWTVGAIEVRIADALSFVAGLLGDKPYLVGDAFTLADISISTALDMWKGAVGKPVPDALAPWHERVRARQAYQRAAKAQKP